jgi:membrane-associated phospholipid phosphatase
LPLATTRSALARLTLVVVGHLVAFGLVYFLTVHTVTGRELADASLRGAIRARPLVTGTVEQILDVVSVASLLGTMAVVAVIALLRLARLEGLVAIGLLAGANVSTWVLKNVLLTRPDLGLDEVAPPTLNSLPSGHATAAFSAVAALVFVLPRRWREVTATVGAGYAALTGVATMLAGWHRAADSVASFLVVGAWGGVAAAVLVVTGSHTAGGLARLGTPRPATPRSTRQPAGRPPTRPRPVGWLVRITLVAGALAAVLAAGLVLASLAPTNPVGSTVAFLAGALFVVAGASGVTFGVLEVLRLVEDPRRARPVDA